VDPNDWLWSIDLTDGYNLVPIHPDLQRLCAFRHRGVSYAYGCLGFGLAWSPYLFTKLWQIPLKHARQHGYRTTKFLDDWLNATSTETESHSALRFHEDLLRSLGAVLSDKKPRTPTQSLEHLGLIIDTVSYTLRLPESRIRKLEHLCTEMLIHVPSGRLPPPLIHRLQGTTAAALLALDQGRAHSRAIAFFQKHKRILPELADELQWWLTQARIQPGRAIRPKIRHLIVTSDAGDDGWGATAWHIEQPKNPVYWHGLFDPTVQRLPAAHREAAAATRALTLAQEHFDLPNQSITGILYRSDSRYTVAMLNGGSHASEQALRDTKRVHALIQTMNVDLHAVHLPGVDNFLADALSRQNNTTEWPTHPGLIAHLEKTMGTFSIDLFASALHHLPGTPYVTAYADPASAWIDAFTRTWEDLPPVWIAPPLALLARVIHHLRAYRPQTGTLLHPYWPSAPWWPALTAMTGVTTQLLPQPWLHAPFGTDWAKTYGQTAGRLREWRWAISHWRTGQPSVEQ
jgi:hypothetical protein